MSERINTPFTNEHFTAYCLKMVGQPYWYGTCGYKATTSLLSRKGKQYPSHYTSSRMSRYKQDIRDKKVVCDCIGGAKGYAWTNGGQASKIPDSIKACINEGDGFFVFDLCHIKMYDYWDAFKKGFDDYLKTVKK